MDALWRLTDAMARLFIAVWPSDDVTALLLALRRENQAGVRFVPPENWHITLRFLGEADPAEAIDALRRITLPAARAHLGPAVDVIAGRALVVPVGGLDTLARRIADGTGQIGDPPRKPFRGHITLARIKPHVVLPDVLGAPVNVAFDVDRIALVESQLGPNGATYATLESWPVG